MSKTKISLESISQTAQATELVTLLGCTTSTCTNNGPVLNGYLDQFGGRLVGAIADIERANDLNENANQATYIQDLQTEQINHMNGVISNMENQKMISQQNYRLSDYSINEARFYSTYAVYGIFTINLVFILAALFVMKKISQVMFMGCVVSLLLFYGICFVIQIYANAQREKIDWNHIRNGQYVPPK